MKKILIISFILISFFSLFSTASKTFNIDQSKVDAIEKKFGVQGKNRVEAWDSMIESSKNESILNQLKNVNDFFNQITYKSDSSVWGVKDYWATPFEFMGIGAGDCEDYAIAKYFSLIKLGVPDEKLRITYVSYRKANSKYEEAHMVLTYYHKVGVEPVVLDNINKTLQLASKRPDLKPVYSFNASGLWQAKTKGEARVGNNELRSWKDLMSRF
ncbi:putative transglutaminase-like cysteine proteinase, C93 family [Arcobacter venerupis]|uniref:Transglutaminase-like cysteine proteinase, C93 family n=1 Tax=Arcobacter venerupis TaxID=1054033 RepID=A0AAE7B7A9_9BACT|nr:transglutaminase-like cysteine peptidase [Arcobacter venerupis]QKF66391.1 putative transglutaminase-like cysteine proteinase, C93 family [Arcobacter venerupis]RWS50832.1 transglutaminase [Arcobacter venerupis]